MKKKLLPLAMLAGLAGAAGTAQAAYLNSDGLGEALIYPFYSVEGGQDTYITVVNTTNLTKAVKVRIIEAENSAEVLDFNLYLSPYDHWAAVITATADGAKIDTADTSCTVPAFPEGGVPFRNYVYDGDSGTQTLARTREGYVEILEMGVLDDDAPDVLGGDGNPISSFGAEAAAKHGASGEPANCSVLVNAWIDEDAGDGTGEWAVSDAVGNPLPLADQGNPAANFATEPALLGGLYGYGVLINVEEGTNATYSAIAMDSFFPDTPIHTDSGFVNPSLSDALGVADIFDSETGSVVSLDYANGIDAVSALFMHNTISNDYVLEPSILAGTDWVLTMPTKREYVNQAAPAALPFLNVWADGNACEELTLEHWNREEQTTSAPPVPGGVDFSPRPPAPDNEPVGFAVCKEVNVISFYGPEGLDSYVSAVHPSSRIQYGFQTEFNNGWARINFRTDNTGNERVLTDLNGNELYGLPVVGFAVQKYTNASLAGVGGEGAFYSGLIEHKYTREIELD